MYSGILLRQSHFDLTSHTQPVCNDYYYCHFESKLPEYSFGSCVPWRVVRKGLFVQCDFVHFFGVELQEIRLPVFSSIVTATMPLTRVCAIESDLL